MSALLNVANGNILDIEYIYNLFDEDAKNSWNVKSHSKIPRRGIYNIIDYDIAKNSWNVEHCNWILCKHKEYFTHENT